MAFVFQPHLNRRQAESVQTISRAQGASAYPSRVNVVVGSLDDNLNSSVLAYMVAGRPNVETDTSAGSSTTIDNERNSPPYALHLPTNMPSYASAATVYRLLCGFFITTDHLSHPSICICTPNGADEDLLSNAVSWFGLSTNQGACEITRKQFWQYWLYASEIIPTYPFSYQRVDFAKDGIVGHHPLRTKMREGTLYSRFIPLYKEHIRLSAIYARQTPDSDSDANVEAEFVGDERHTPMPVKIRWAKEAFLPAGILVGDYDQIVDVEDLENTDLSRLQITLASICHYCFIYEPRTANLYYAMTSENTRLRSVLANIGFSEFQTPSVKKPEGHYMLNREDFWHLCPLDVPMATTA